MKVELDLIDINMLVGALSDQIMIDAEVQKSEIFDTILRERVERLIKIRKIYRKHIGGQT